MPTEMCRLFLKLGLLSVALLFAGGCSTVTVQSATDPAAVRKLDRLFTIVTSGQIKDQAFTRSLVTGLVNCSTNTTAQIKVVATSPLDLDEKVYDRQIAEFHPDAVLVISVQTSLVDPYGGYPSITYDASLYETNPKKRIWRASIVNTGSTDMMDRRMRKMAASIIGQLKLDGFL